MNLVWIDPDDWTYIFRMSRSVRANLMVSYHVPDDILLSSRYTSHQAIHRSRIHSKKLKRRTEGPGNEQ